MQVNDQKSVADRSSNRNSANTSSSGLVKGILDSVLSGKESAVIVPKAQNIAQHSIENNKNLEQKW